jgi:hypothetical protein
MPVCRRDYHPQWPWISYYIRHYRAQNQCEACGLANHSLYPASIRINTSFPLFENNHAALRSGTKVLLTVAHLDGNTKNNDFRNLMCLCTHCHLNRDRNENNQKKKYGRKRQTQQCHLFS